MENSEPTQHFGGIINYFGGARINHFTINYGNIKKPQDNNTEYHAQQPAEAPGNDGEVSAAQVAAALSRCRDYLWGNAAYAVAFCVCRDVYGWPNNAAGFERQMQLQGISMPPGTIHSAISRNRYMRMPVDKWEKNGAMQRVLAMKEQFMEQMEAAADKETERKTQEKA